MGNLNTGLICDTVGLPGSALAVRSGFWWGPPDFRTLSFLFCVRLFIVVEKSETLLPRKPPEPDEVLF